MCPQIQVRASDPPTPSDWSEMQERVIPLSRASVLELAVRQAYSVRGEIVEFGVGKGGSTRVLRRTLTSLERGRIGVRRKKIYACDSFKGLRERFERAAVGTFACKPPKIHGVEIVEGYFEDSLTPDLARRVARVALASLDADLYSSTLCALRWLTPLLHTGSLLLFDEYLGEHGSERRAHEDWLRESGLQTIQLAEFFREPSGWGAAPDRRMLVQVIGPEPFERTRPTHFQEALRRLVRVLSAFRS